MKTLAISVSGHDSSIALFFDNELITTYSCERINREKHTGMVYEGDIDIIAKNYTKNVDLLVLVNTPPDYNNRIRGLLKKVGIAYNTVIVDNDNHHLFHAAASYYPLGLDNAVCIVVDGAGSSFSYDDIATMYEVTSFFEAKDTIQTLYKKFFFRKKLGTPKPGWNSQQIQKLKEKFPFEIDLTSHLDTGEMYGTVTRYLGFKSLDGGKTMGLSAYGKPNNLPPILLQNTCITNNNLFRNDKQIDFEVHPRLMNPTEILKQNMAYNVQRALESMFVDKVKRALTFSTSKNIIISGGCALNILGNSTIKRVFKDHNVYVEPIGTDSAQSLGAAYYYYKKANPSAKFKKFENLYYGPTLNVRPNDVDRLVRHYNESSLQIISN